MPDSTPTSPAIVPRDIPTIRRLELLLVNQIAAGEVVERPASVVKELVENALDAGATRLRVELEQGGIELVRVSDDGCGIAEAQLALALAPHATSKIEHAEDLDRISTMGFRGEALASIASVGRLTLRSRPEGQPGAVELIAEGDAVHPPRPASGPPGTTVEVRNLFFNTPARRKFLKTATTERTRCLDWLTNLAMAHPAVGFAVVAEGKTRIDVPPGQAPRDRAVALLGAELEDQLLEIHADAQQDERGAAMWGLIGLPTLARATSKAQHVFLNGRVIADRTVAHALRSAYQGLIEPGRHPTAVLMLEMSPAAVDVNVHPQKLEVRFRDSSMVHQLVHRAARDALAARDLTPVVQPRAGHGGVLPGSPTRSGSGAAKDAGSGVGSGVETKAFVDYFTRDLPAQASQGGRLSYDALRRAVEGEPDTPDRPDLPAATGLESSDEPGGKSRVASGGQDPAVHSVPSDMAVPRPAPSMLQVHNSYVLTQDEHGVVIVDQHALHERAMFELLLRRVADAPLESQRLLTPSVVDAPGGVIETLDALRPLLVRLGIDAEPAGPKSVAVHAFPTFLFERNVDPAVFLGELLDRASAEDFRPGEEEALHEVLDMMACKAAIKAGDRLGSIELEALLDLRDDIERSSNCPHGRPTSVRLTIKELERLFGRS